MNENKILELRAACWSALLRYCRRNKPKNSYVTAEEIAEEVFDEYIVKVRSKSIDEPIAYMIKMAKRRLSYYGKRSLYSVPDGRESAFHESYHDVVTRIDYTGMISNAAYLTPLQKQVLILHFIRGLDVETIAHILHTTKNCVRSARSQGLKRIREFKSSGDSDIIARLFVFKTQKKSGLSPPFPTTTSLLDSRYLHPVPILLRVFSWCSPSHRSNTDRNRCLRRKIRQM